MASNFRVLLPQGILLLFLADLVVLAGCYLAAVEWLQPVDAGIWLLYDGGLTRVSIAVFSLIIGFYFTDLYSQVRIPSRTWLLQQVSLTLGCAFFLQSLFSYSAVGLMLPKWPMIFGSFAVLVSESVWRIVYSERVLPAVAQRRVLFVGRTSATEEVADYMLEHPELGYLVLGFVDDQDAESAPLATLAPLARTKQAIEQYRPDEVVVGIAESSYLPIYGDLLEFRFSEIAIEPISATYERVFGRVLIRDVTVAELLFGLPIQANSFITKLQTLVSIMISLVGAALTLPIMILTALAVKLTSRGPVLFKQERVGLNGRIFRVWKFRTMYVNSDPVTGPRGRDPRITPLGWYLRKLRLDELPQFFNVLKGDMLIVGPRPEIPVLTQRYIEKVPLYRQRLLVKPGVTGWAQINHKVEESLEDTIRKLGFDLYYIKHMSLAFDAWVIFHTAKTMLLGKGAR